MRLTARRPALGRTSRDTQPLGGGGQFARNSGFGSIAGLCTALASFLTTVIVAHLLGVESTGLMAYMLWITYVAGTVADLGVQSALARFLPELAGARRWSEAEAVSAYLFRPLAASSVITLSGFVLYAGLQWKTGATDELEPALWLIIGGITFLLTLTGYCYGLARGTQRFDQLALLAILSLVMQLAGVALGSVLGGLVGAMSGCCAGLVLPAIYGVSAVPRRRRLADELKRRVWGYALYAWGGSLASVFVWSRVEIFFLQHATGAEAVGLFSVSLTLSNLAAQGPILLTAGLLPYFAASFGRGALDEIREAYATATRVLAFVVLPACFGLAAIMPQALPLIYGKAFAAAVPAAMILLVAAGVAAMSTVGSNLIFAAERSDFIFASGLAAAVLSVVGGLTLVQSFGLMGAVCVRAGVQLVAAGLGCWFVIRRLHCPIPFRDLGRIVIAASLCGAAARATLLLPMGVAGLPAAIVIGGVIYLLFSRLLLVLPPQDVVRLRSLSCALPVQLHGFADRLLRLVFEHREGLVETARQPRAVREATPP